jgi:transcriptional regulator with XRE-family HTH domain
MKSKIKRNINEQEFFKQLLESIPNKVKKSVRISMDIATQINFILKQKKLSQRDLADLLGKKESEISKWLSGNHNFTTKTLGNIEDVLGEDIISVPLFTKKEIKFIPIQAYSQSFQTNKLENYDTEPSFSNIEDGHLWELIINCNSGCYGTENIS